MIKVLDYQVPQEGPYIVLEGQFKQNKASKIIHVLNLGKQNNIKIGRGNKGNFVNNFLSTIGIRISDISVSRVHATLKVIDKKFYIEDNNSKFGTLVGFREPILINKPVWVQVGRSILNFSPNKGK